MDRKSCMLKHTCVSILVRAAITWDVQGTQHTKRPGAVVTTPLPPPKQKRTAGPPQLWPYTAQPPHTDKLTVFYTCACRYRRREKITVPINWSFGHISSRSRKENLEPKPSLCQSSWWAQEPKNTPLSTGRRDASTRTHRPHFSSSILSNCLSEATCNWICQAPF